MRVRSQACVWRSAVSVCSQLFGQVFKPLATPELRPAAESWQDVKRAMTDSGEAQGMVPSAANSFNETCSLTRYLCASGSFRRCPPHNLQLVGGLRPSIWRFASVLLRSHGACPFLSVLVASPYLCIESSWYPYRYYCAPCLCQYWYASLYLDPYSYRQLCQHWFDRLQFSCCVLGVSCSISLVVACRSGERRWRGRG